MAKLSNNKQIHLLNSKDLRINRFHVAEVLHVPKAVEKTPYLPQLFFPTIKKKQK